MSGNSIFGMSAKVSRALVFTVLGGSLAFFAFSPSLNAQGTKKLPRIGALWPGDVKLWNDALFNALHEPALLIAKLLHGAKPNDLPIEYPMRIRLVVNLRTAKSLGLTIPESVLIQADEVIR